MTTGLVGDRFMRRSSGQWLDLATGASVMLTIQPEGTETDNERCAREMAAPPPGHRPGLIDFGYSGGRAWFEARTWEEPTFRDLADAASVESVVSRVTKAGDVRSGAGIRCVRLRERDRVVKIAASEVARRLRANGFVTLRADVALAPVTLEELRHRHLVLQIDCGDARGVAWIRSLSKTSPRAHVVVVNDMPAQVGRVRDRGSGYRADDRDRRDLSDLAARGTQAAGEMAELVAAGELDRAESLGRAVEAEALVLSEAMPEIVRLGQVQVSFWQGRFEEAWTYATTASTDSIDGLGWRGLIAWALGNEAELGHAIAQLRSGRAAWETREAWLARLDLLHGVAAGAPVGVFCRAAALRERLRGRPPDQTWLDRALVVEGLLAVGRAAEAHRLCSVWSRPGGRDSLGPLARALLARVRTHARGPFSLRSDAAEQFITRTGARGLRRWGLGRAGMNVLNGVTALLELVHDADDEQVALKRGCSWVREHAGADAVGIVTNEGGAFVVCDGLGRADWGDSDLQSALQAGANGAQRTVADGPHALVTAPMRYGGVTIGFAVVKGRRDAATTLAEAGTALASACAPALRARLDAIALAGAGETLAPEILGSSPSMVAMRQAIARSAHTSFSVLVEGESGTGKELVARAVHRLSARRDRRFCAINCAALTDELVEAELFGYVRGAFTGAVSARTGLFEDAHGGTVFLDEVSELSGRGQAKLLRVLQEREIRRVGENAPRAIDVRVIAATNQPLSEAAARGRFREDLLFRLAVVRIRVPTLRDRIEDVPVLAYAFWRKLAGETGKRVQVGSDAVAALCRYRWPGNVRELQNVIAGLVVAAPTRGRIGARHVEQVLADSCAHSDAAGQSLDSARHAFERRMVAAALARHGGRRTRAAVELGISRQGLTKAIKRLGLGGVA